MKKGDKVRYNLPAQIPAEFSSNTTGWWSVLQENLGREGELIMELDCRSHEGWTISLGGTNPPTWVPTAWIVPMGASPVKVPCNCPWTLVLQTGCKNPNHD